MHGNKPPISVKCCLYLIIRRFSLVARHRRSEIVLERIQGRRAPPFGNRRRRQETPAPEMPVKQNPDGDEADESHERAEEGNQVRRSCGERGKNRLMEWDDASCKSLTWKQVKNQALEKNANTERGMRENSNQVYCRLRWHKNKRMSLERSRTRASRNGNEKKHEPPKPHEKQKWNRHWAYYQYRYQRYALCN